MYDLIRGRAEGLRERMAGFASGLIRIPSVSLDEGKAAEAVEKEMLALGYDKVFRDGNGNVAGIIFGREAKPVLLLCSHLDTVSPEGKAWTKGAYSGAAEGGRIYGAGASDCKGGTAAQIYAGALLKKSLLPFRGTLVVAATVAEENGRSVGLRGLLSGTLPGMGCMPDYVVLGEPTDLGLYLGHDGWVEMNIHIEGPSPFLIGDAAARMAASLRRIYGARLSGAESPAQPSEEMNVGSPEFLERGGLRSADIRISKRLRGGETAESATGWLRQEACMLAKPADSGCVSVEVVEETQKLYTGRRTVVRSITNAWSTDPFSPLVLRARQALAAMDCEVRMGRWRLGRLGMGTAGSVITEVYNIPVVGYGPGSEDQAHSADEYVEAGKIFAAALGTASIAHSLVGIPVCGWTSDEI